MGTLQWLWKHFIFPREVVEEADLVWTNDTEAVLLQNTKIINTITVFHLQSGIPQIIRYKLL